MVEVDIETTKASYQAEYDTFVARLQVLDQQRAQLLQAIQERRGILIFLASLENKQPVE